MSSTESVHELFHKEKNQKKYNNATGHIDNLRGYDKSGNVSTGKSDDFATDDKQIKREARYIKNIHIDNTLERLKAAKLITREDMDGFYCQVMHGLGVARVTAMADIAMNKCRDGSTPAALFHFLLNKEWNKHNDKANGGYMPRFN